MAPRFLFGRVPRSKLHQLLKLRYAGAGLSAVLRSRNSLYFIIHYYISFFIYYAALRGTCAYPSRTVRSVKTNLIMFFYDAETPEVRPCEGSCLKQSPCFSDGLAAPSRLPRWARTQSRKDGSYTFKFE